MLKEGYVEFIQSGGIKHYPLHVAAAMGDISALHNLLRSGTSIEQRDELNLTPLQVACVSGQTEAVSFLISKGANVFAVDGYKLKLNVLDLAILQSHAPVVTVLINQGHILDKASVYDMAYYYNTAFSLVWSLAPSETPALVERFNAALDTFIAIVETRQIALLEFEASQNSRNNAEDITGIPASVLMEIVASLVKNQSLYDRLMFEIDKINASDSSYQTYLDAKALFHVLPVEGNYFLTYHTSDGTPYLSKITAEGHWGSFTTPMAYNMIESYIENKLSSDNLLSIRIAFEVMKDVYSHAALYSRESAIFTHSSEAYNHYLNGEMVLLPTGWNGHFVNVILDPVHEYFIVANCGMRFHSLSSGANIYKMYNPSNLNPNLIYSILNNTDQMDLELVFKYQLALDKVDVLWQPDQMHGNCSWQSHEPAVETLLYLDLLNQSYSPLEAKALAHHYYEDWDAYQTMAHLKNYFLDKPNNLGGPNLSIYALKDILIENHPSLFKNKTYKNSQIEINAAEYEQAKYIVEVLNQDVYKKDVSVVFADLYKTAKPELLNLFKTAGFIMKTFDKKDSYETADALYDHDQVFESPLYLDQSVDQSMIGLEDMGLDDIFQNHAILPFPGLEFILKQYPDYFF